MLTDEMIDCLICDLYYKNKVYKEIVDDIDLYEYGEERFDLDDRDSYNILKEDFKNKEFFNEFKEEYGFSKSITAELVIFYLIKAGFTNALNKDFYFIMEDRFYHRAPDMPDRLDWDER